MKIHCETRDCKVRTLDNGQTGDEAEVHTVPLAAGNGHSECLKRCVESQRIAHIHMDCVSHYHLTQHASQPSPNE